MKKEEILKIIIAIFVVIAIGCTIILKYIKKTTMTTEFYTQEDLEIVDKEIENYMSDKVTPKGLSKLYGNYKGHNDLNDLYRSLYKFVNYLPTLSKKVKYESNDSIITFYSENIIDIKNNLGITTEDDFKNFIGFLNKVEYKGEKFLDCKLDSTTFNQGNTYFSFDLTFNFEELANEFKLKVNFANNVSTKPMVKYSIIDNDVIE